MATNPFPVYPVRSLSDISDIRAATVPNPETDYVKSAVEDYVKGFRVAGATKNQHLVLAVKGDFGTGKTHLMLYARRILEDCWAGNTEASTSPSGSPNSLPGTPVSQQKASADLAKPGSVSVLAAASEVPIEDWYSGTLGPALARTNPRQLVRALQTQIACEIADESPLTQHLSDEFRSNPRALVEALRSGDEINASSVQERFTRRITELLPNPDPDLIRVLLSLRREETASTGEAWLSGRTLTPDECQEIGVSEHSNTAVRASTSVVAIAAICRELRCPFAIFVDEFEHLARYDKRLGSRRNVTWMKRVVERLAQCGSMAFIGGHWEAWEQQGDFLDRFMGRAPITLVRLTAEEIGRIIEVCAPQWRSCFSREGAERVIEATNGNVRRAMTLLYDLYAKYGNSNETIVPDMVAKAAAARLLPDTSDNLFPALEKVARAAGLTMTRGEQLDFGTFNAVLRLNGEVRELVHVVSGRDESVLLEEGESFADSVRRARQTLPKVRGIFVALGAVNPTHLKTLDAARNEIDVVNGEDPKFADVLAEALKRTMQAPPNNVAEKNDSSVNELREELARLRQELLDQKRQQAERSASEFADDGRASSIAGAIGPTPGMIDLQEKALNDRRMVEHLVNKESGIDWLLYLDSPSVRIGLGLSLLGLGAAGFSNILVGAILPRVTSQAQEDQYQLLVNQLQIFGVIIAAVSFLLLVDQAVRFMRRHRSYLRELEFLRDNAAPPHIIFDFVRNSRDTKSGPTELAVRGPGLP